MKKNRHNHIKESSMEKDERTVPLEIIFERANQVIKNKSLPNQSANTISEVVGAVVGLPKEYVLYEMLKRNEEINT